MALFQELNKDNELMKKSGMEFLRSQRSFGGCGWDERWEKNHYHKERTKQINFFWPVCVLCVSGGLKGRRSMWSVQRSDPCL